MLFDTVLYDTHTVCVFIWDCDVKLISYYSFQMFGKLFRVY